MNNNNNSNAPARGRRNKRANAAAPPDQGGQPPQKKRKVSNRQRKRRARVGRAAAEFALDGRALAGKGRTRGSASNKRDFVVEETEYVGEVTPANAPAFNNVQLPVNPGQVQTFPWLSTIAKNFEKYQFERLEFIYKREVSEFAANGQIGKVIYSFDTDPSDPAPFGKQEMEATEPHEDGLPSENFRMPIPPKMLQPLMNDAHFVRPGTVPAGADIKTYDVGTLNVATQATAANTATGELHVRYRVRLMIPVLPPGGSQGAGALQGAGGSLAQGTPFGAVPLPTGQIVLSGAATNVLSITNVQIGQEISIVGIVGGTVITATNWQTLVGMTQKTSLAVNALNAAATQGVGAITATITALNPTIALAVLATTVTSSEVIVTILAPAPAF